VRKPSAFAGFPTSLRCGYGPFMGSVAHIVDGDTYDLLLDLGCNTYPYLTCRLLGVDTPESNRLATRTAGLAAKTWVQQRMPIGSPVRVHTEPDPDSFGRYLVTLTLPDGADLATELVTAGHAIHWRPR
jgi:endonuclease YncB( thermonuclease family)